MGENTREPEIEGLRFVTYLSSGLPQALFEGLADHAQRALGDKRVSLRVETRVSGPRKGDECSTFADKADVAFMCSSSFVWLRELRPPPAELLGVAPVFDDERNAGRPVYFCDVVVRDDAPVQTFSDLQGSAWTYNDACSLSGYYGLLNKLTESGTDETFFRSVSCSGSHLNSIDAILRGKADAATVDSNVLRIKLRETPALGKKLRVIESWGPYPIQPVVVNSSLHPEIKQRLRTAFFTTNEDEHTRQTLRRFGLSRFAPVGQQDYSLATHENLASLLSTPKT